MSPLSRRALLTAGLAAAGDVPRRGNRGDGATARAGAA